MLNKFNVKEVGTLEERIVHLGMDEGLKLLKASLESNAVLTNVFLCGQLTPYPFQPIEVPLWMISRPTLKSVLEHLEIGEGNSVSEPYIVSHSLLLGVLAHATVVELYRETRWTNWN
ncbi:hypothetical protein CerSpe_243990 [Prunus speciosa]